MNDDNKDKNRRYDKKGNDGARNGQAQTGQKAKMDE